MGLAGIDATTDRLRAEDWRDKYRWPDPDLGWVGGLAGYLPDSSARGGRACPPGVVFPGDAGYLPPPGMEGRHYDSAKVGGKPAYWLAQRGVSAAIAPREWVMERDETPINSPAEKARKLKIADGLGVVKRASSLLDATEMPATEMPATETLQRKGRPKKDGSLSATERSRLHRARKRIEV
jgi:hypothetical protein